ncbi:MAG: glycosyltransferase family 2 protein [Deltaproteobacteria bacterium]|jgi:glycosyltransferase involved in cell wall biosynthesis|nr:glycosyltransferase family 2 protein [Deltaproteobacteria bacterium]
MKLYAVTFVWNEDDIIEATVRNAFAQGCDKMFVIDNGSTDATVANAVKAGAEFAGKVDIGYHVERLKYETINSVIRQVNQAENDASIWWLILDGDEFPDTRLGISVRQWLASLDPAVNVAAAEVLNHLPTHPPYNIPGFHPIHFQPFEGGISMHKLPLIRYDKGKPHIMSMAGAHTYKTHDGGYLTGPDHKLLFHHFNYRKPEKSLLRLKLLTEVRPDGTRRIDKKDEYARRMGGKRIVYWERMEGLKTVFQQAHNRHLAEFPESHAPRRLPLWYELDDIKADAFSSENEYLFWRAGALLYEGRPGEALEIFADLLERFPQPYLPLAEKFLALCR